MSVMSGEAGIFLTAVLLGIALAMDAFSVSIANGLCEPSMGRAKKLGIPGTYAFFQFAMPVIGWVCVRTIEDLFAAFQKWIPWIALILLAYIGGKMLFEGIRLERCRRAGSPADGPADGAAVRQQAALGFGALMVQGLATSIDALSTGFAFSEYSFFQTIASALIIAVETFVISRAGLAIGLKAGKPDSGKASVAGGLILIGIGIKIFIQGIA